MIAQFSQPVVLLRRCIVSLFVVGCVLYAGSIQAQAATTYPLLSLYYVDCCFTQAQAKDIAKFDLVIVTMEAAEYNLEGIKTLRELNPKIKILPYVPSQGVVTLNASATRQRLIDVLQDDWYLRRPNGSIVSRYTGESDLNITRSDTREAIASFVADLNNDKCGSKNCWDGVFFDVVEDNLDYLGGLDLNRDGVVDSNVNSQWVAGYKELFKSTRSKIGKDKLIIINGASNLDMQSDINGRMFEDFPTPWHANGQWDGVSENVPTLEQYNMDPVGIIFSAQGSETDYKKMRFSIASGLVSGTYAGYDNGVDKHNSVWLYDEYLVNLGKAHGKARNLKNPNNPYKIQNGVWRRDFDNGIVLLNSTSKNQTITLESGYEKVRGTKEKKVNNGATTGKITLKPKDAIILRRRLQQIDDAAFFNGAFTNIYSNKGKRVRTSFFAFNRKYEGGTVIHHLADGNKTIVADKTYVTVYKGSKKLARFAPFGTSYRGGLSMDIDRLEAPDKKGAKKGRLKPYRIVVGAKTGSPSIKMYDLTGKKISNGCDVFSAGQVRGVNLAIGDVIKEKSGKEIIVAPATSGKPEVRIYNAQCKRMKGGFTAYDTGVTSGVSLASGDLDGDGFEEIVTMPAARAGSFVRVFRMEKSKKKVVNNGFYAFPKSNKSGGFITISDIDEDGTNEIVPMSYGIFNF